MKSKQVKGVEQGSAKETPPKTADPQPKNLYVKVDTFDTEGREIGTRIVDMYHFGTNNWFRDHNWWAMHNHHTIEINACTPAQVDAHMAAQTAALAAKYNSPHEQHAAA